MMRLLHQIAMKIVTIPNCESVSLCEAYKLVLTECTIFDHFIFYRFQQQHGFLIIVLYTVSQKKLDHISFEHNFRKYYPIFIILSLFARQKLSAHKHYLNLSLHV